jgi:hypothetical protein
MGPHPDRLPPRPADVPDDEAALLAARKMFAGMYDIKEVFGGYLAVPDGVEVTQSTTVGGLVGKLRMRARAEGGGDDG